MVFGSKSQYELCQQKFWMLKPQAIVTAGWGLVCSKKHQTSEEMMAGGGMREVNTEDSSFEEDTEAN